MEDGGDDLPQMTQGYLKRKQKFSTQSKPKMYALDDDDEVLSEILEDGGIFRDKTVPQESEFIDEALSDSDEEYYESGSDSFSGPYDNSDNDQEMCSDMEIEFDPVISGEQEELTPSKIFVKAKRFLNQEEARPSSTLCPSTSTDVASDSSAMGNGPQAPYDLMRFHHLQ